MAYDTNNIPNPYQYPFNTLQPFPTASPGEIMSDGERRLLTKKRIAWAWDLGRFAAFAPVPIEGCESFLDHILAQTRHEFSDKDRIEFMNNYLSGVNRGNHPPDELERIAECCHWFEDNLGAIPAPRWCTRATTYYSRMWLAVHILGYGGEDFPFAWNAVANALGANYGRATRLFIKHAKDCQLLVTSRRGISRNPSGGTSARTDSPPPLNPPQMGLYRLKEDKDAHLLFDIIPEGTPSAKVQEMKSAWEAHLKLKLGWRFSEQAKQELQIRRRQLFEIERISF